MKDKVTLQPGLLVSLRTSLDGGVNYMRVDLKSDTGGDGVSKIEEWKTTKVVNDPEEHKRASAVRNAARAAVAKVCTQSSFGPICLKSREGELDEAMAEAKKMVEDFNRDAKTCRVGIYVLKGEIAQTDDEAARGIADELRELMDEMKAGIAEVDVKRIRDAATRASKMGKVLDEGAGKKVSAAVEEAREVAKQIVKKATEKGANVAEYVTSVTLKSIESARFAFLDLTETEESAAPAGPTATARQVDLPGLDG